MPHEASTGTALAASVACLCFGASVVATRFVVGQTSPVVLACLRYAMASVCMIALFRAQAFPRMPARDRLTIAALGVLFFGVFPWSFSASLTHLPSAQVALIVATNPLVTLLLSRLRGVERITPRAMAGQLLAFAGLALALPLHAGGAPVASDAWLGYLEIATTVVCGATYNVWSRPMLMRYGAPPVTTIGMVAGSMALAPLAFADGLTAHLRTITPAGWGGRALSRHAWRRRGFRSVDVGAPTLHAVARGGVPCAQPDHGDRARRAAAWRTGHYPVAAGARGGAGGDSVGVTRATDMGERGAGSDLTGRRDGLGGERMTGEPFTRRASAH